MNEPIPPKAQDLRKQTAAIKRSARAVEASTAELMDSADVSTPGSLVRDRPPLT